MRDGDRAAASEDAVLPALELVHVAQRRASRSARFAGGGTIVVVVVARRAARAARLLRAPRRPRRWSGCRPGCCSAARSATSIDRVRDGAVTDFLKLPAWPAFNVADIAITFGVLALLCVVERADVTMELGPA